MQMKFTTGELGPDPDDWMIYEVRRIVKKDGKDNDGLKRYSTSNYLRYDGSINQFEYRRDYKANSCKYYCIPDKSE